MRAEQRAARASARSLTILVAALAAAGALPAPAAAAEGALPAMDADLARLLGSGGEATVEAIVLMEQAVTRADLQRALDHGLLVTAPLRTLPSFAVHGKASDVREFLASGGVSWAEWNRPLELHVETSRVATRAASVDGNVPGMGGPLTLGGVPIDGTGVGIAVVDGGIDATHPDLLYGAKTLRNVAFTCASPGLSHTGTSRCYANSLAEITLNPDELDPCNEEAFDPNARYVDHWREQPTTDHSSGHGTHVAGIAAGWGNMSGGKFRGVAPGSAVYGLGTGEAIAVLYANEAFDWILCNHDQVDPPIKVVNNSWGTPPSTSGCAPPAGYDQPQGGVTRLLVDRMVQAGITVVFSSGNSGGNGSVACNSPQSRIPTAGVLGVANYDDDDRGNRDGPLSSSSSRGLSSASRWDTWPDISAPGTFVTATISRTGHTVNAPVVFSFPEPRHAPNYVILSGTSMAAPHVAGIVALMLQANPALTPAQVEDILEDTAHKFNFPGGGPYRLDPFNPDNTGSFDKGHGLADARAAVLAAAALAGAAPGDTPAEPVELLNGKRFYLRTGPTGLGNVDHDYENWSPDPPTKAAPSAWHDIEPLLNSDPFEIPALHIPGAVSVVNQDVKLRFWAGGGASADLTSPAAPGSWRVSLRIGGTVLTQVVTETAPVYGPREYNVVWPAVTASGTSMKVVFDSASSADTANPTNSRENNFGNMLLYDSTRFPTSLGFGVEPDASPGLGGGANQVCIAERPGTCFTTIQQAVDAAAEGETAVAGPGTYAEAVVVAKAMAVESSAGAAATVIRAPAGASQAVRVAADDVTLAGFTIEHAQPTTATALVRATAALTLEDSVLAASAGAALATQGSGGATVGGATLGAPVAIDHAGSGALVLEGNVLSRAGGTGLAARAGSGAASVESNAFSGFAIHVLDDGAGLDLAALQDANAFDRLVRVEAGGTLTGALYGSVHSAVQAAPAGATVLVRTGTYPEAVAIPPGKDGLTLCSTTGPMACADAPAATTLDATGVAPAALVVRSDDVTVRGLTLRAASEPGVGVDAAGTSGFALRGSRVEAGPASAEAALLGGVGGTLPSSFAGPLATYLRDPFVASTLGSPALALVRAAHAGEQGLLSVVPTEGPDAHVALVYRGAAPQAVKDALAASGGEEHGLPVRVHEHARAEALRARVDDAYLEGLEVLDAPPAGPLLPGPTSGIGPGAHLLITIPSNLGVGGSDEGGTFRCTANFLFQQGAQHYLGTAGHCVLQTDAPDSFSSRFIQPSRIRVCIADCVGSTVRATGTYLELGGNNVFYARQEAGGTGFGQDFGFIQLPASVAPLLRPWVWLWAGPTGTITPALGQPIAHYGHGVGVGEVFPTEGRAGIALGGLVTDPGGFDGLGWVTGGDSGSGAVSAQPRLGQALVGREAVGDLTHSITGIGAPLFLGTLVTQALDFTEASTGQRLELILEHGGTTPIPVPRPIGVDLSGTVGARVEGNVIVGGAVQAEPGVGVLAEGTQDARVEGNEVRGWRGEAALLADGSTANQLRDNAFAQGCDGVVLRDAPGNTLAGNAFEAFACEGVLVTGTGGAQSDGNLLRRNTFRSTASPLVVAGTDGIVVDARANDWATYEWQDVEAQAQDLGEGNDVRMLPFLLADGTLEPGLVAVEGGSCAGRTPEAPETACGFLSVGEALDAALAGATVRAPGSANADNPTPRREAVRVATQGVRLCASPAGEAACAPAQATAVVDSTGTGLPAVQVAAADVAVEGFTLRAAEDGVVAADLRGAANPALRDAAMRAGAVPFAGDALFEAVEPFAGSEAATWADPWVREVVGSQAYRDLVAKHHDNPRFLGASVSASPRQVDLLFAGAVPLGAGGKVLGAPVVGHLAELQPAARKLPADVAAQIAAKVEAPDGFQAPSAAVGIGPGSLIIISRSDGTFLCTANWVWEGSDGKLYLGAAGHCFLADGIDSSQAPGYAPPSVSVCVRGCSVEDQGLGVFGEFVALGSVPYTVQEIEAYYTPVLPPELDDGTCQLGCDFGVVEIPAALHGLVRPWMWMWRGPTGSADAALGDPVVHYGHGLGVGQAFPSKGRAGVALGTYATGEWFAWQSPSAPGDSGSAVAIGGTPGGEVLRGLEAAGVLTHLIVCTNDFTGCVGPAVGGTTMGRSVQLVRDAIGLELTLVTEDVAFAPPPTPAVNVGVHLGAAAGGLVLRTDVEVQGGAEGFGVRTDAATAGAEIQESTLRAGTVAVLAEGSQVAVRGSALLGAGAGAAPGSVGFLARGGASDWLLEDSEASGWGDAGVVQAASAGPGTVRGGELRGNGIAGARFEAAGATLDGALVAANGQRGVHLLGHGAVVRGAAIEQHLAAGPLAGPGDGVGVWIDGAAGALVEDSTFATTGVAVRVDDPAGAAGEPAGVALHGNVFRLAEGVGTSLALGPAVDLVALDAERNCWGASTLSGVRGRIRDEGQGNAVDVVPFYDAACAALIAEPVASFTRSPADPVYAVVDALRFEDTSSDGGAAIASRAWDLGDGTTSGEAVVEHTYAAPGTYTVTLTVRNRAELESTATATLDLLAWVPPTAAFAAAPNPTDRLTPVQFTDQSTLGTGSVTHAWAFGDGAASSEASPAHTYAALGTFAATLTLTDTKGQRSTATLDIRVVNLPPTAAGSSDALTTDRLTAVQFADASTDPDGTVASWRWSFGDGATSAQRNPAHTYPALGTFTPTLTVVDNDGAEATVALPAITVVNLVPTAAGSSDRASTDRITAVRFTDASTDLDGTIASWRWAFGDGATSTQRDPAYTYPALGTFTPTLTVVDNDGAEATVALPAITVVNLPPRAAFDVSGQPSNRVDPTMFTDRSVDPDDRVASWRWDFGDGATSTAASPSHTYASLGTFTVTLTVRDADGGEATATATVEVVNLLPSVDFVVDPEVPTALLPAFFDGTAVDRDGSIATWAWDLGNGLGSDQEDPVTVYVEGGRYEVTLTVTDDDGGVATITQDVWVCAPGATADGIVTLEHIRIEIQQCLHVNGGDLLGLLG